MLLRLKKRSYSFSFNENGAIWLRRSRFVDSTKLEKKKWRDFKPLHHSRLERSMTKRRATALLEPPSLFGGGGVWALEATHDDDPRRGLWLLSLTLPRRSRLFSHSCLSSPRAVLKSNTERGKEAGRGRIGECWTLETIKRSI